MCVYMRAGVLPRPCAHVWRELSCGPCREQRAGLREKPELYCAWPQATLFTKPATRQLYNGADVCSSGFGACI